MPLTDTQIRALSVPAKYFDGQGLYLEVTKAGGRHWRLKYRFGGKEKRLALGTYPETTLKVARAHAADARKHLANDTDPGELRKAAKRQFAEETINTLEAVARDWLTHQAARWADVTKTRIQASLEADIFPTLGARPISSIRPGEIMKAVKAVEARGAADQADRVLKRVKAVFRWAISHERIETNPMVDLMPAEILKPRQVTHRPALKDADLPEYLARLDQYQGEPTTQNALRLLMLTAVRPGELRGARWDEFDLTEARWTIPAARMKMKREHIVPLSRQALAVLGEMYQLSGGGELVFPSPFYPSQSISENTLNSALARMGFKGNATAHGFRSLFSTVANECNWNPDTIERQLAHVERNQVRAAYHRSEYMDDRVKLLQWWADYIDGRRTGKLLKMRKRAA